MASNLPSSMAAAVLLILVLTMAHLENLATAAAISATMTINSFEKGGDGGGPSACDGKYHSNSQMIVALSTRWFAKGKRCLRKIRISAKGKSVYAMVVDECDSNHGCKTNIVDASKAVWDALGIHGDQVGEMKVTWSDT